MPPNPPSPNDPPLAVVTGGEGDLAREIVRALEDSGYEVAAPGRHRLDVTSPDDVSAFFSSEPAPQLLVNNAGVTSDAMFSRLDESSWDRVLDTNLKGAFLCAKAAAKGMLIAGGHIINIGSFSALSPPFGQTNYATAKAGLIGLTQSLAAEFGAKNIRVNCVLPGFLNTRMTEHLPEAARERALRAHTLRRFNTAEDAARFITFLDSMPHVSGQVFQLDSRLRPQQ